MNSDKKHQLERELTTPVEVKGSTHYKSIELQSKSMLRAGLRV